VTVERDDSVSTPDDRQPHTPYPGLRPFLDYEFMLLHGRDRQIDDVIDRLGRPIAAFAPQLGGKTLASNDVATDVPPALATMRFVAVLGGSGSGKSSLVRAGVVPKLRKAGLPAVGDLWEAVVSTPGSNFARHATGASQDTPITCLANDIAAVLGPPRAGPAGVAPPVSAEQRRDHITELLRQPGGLDTVVDLYGPELNLPRSVDATKACMLVVIDQFEELFHRSNRGQPDVEALIQRVIDHFHQARNGEGSPRCFLAITMRSEHLQDCAAYIGLPEAINAGAYLISRLDSSDLRAVIERPAQRYLRLRQRRRPVEASLPVKVVFEPAVIERLIDDALKIKDDPDHLPLLQHALAQLWRAACKREGRPAGSVPDKLTLADLRRTVQPGASAELAPDETLVLPGNVLVDSLQMWADHNFAQHTAADQALLSALLRQLAYKDPASGTYTQQRYVVADHPGGEGELRRLLGDRWIHGVNYLFLDERKGAVLKLKISHEAFVRKWLHFRQLVDDDAMRFERFKELLEWCEDWSAAKGWRNRLSRLLAPALLKRMNEARVAEALGPSAAGPLDQSRSAEPRPLLWDKWREWIEPERSDDKPERSADQLLSVDLAAMRRFYRLSDRKAKAGKVSIGLVFLLFLVVLPLLIYSTQVQQPFMVSSIGFLEVADRNLKLKPKPLLDSLDDNMGMLGELLKTVQDFDKIKVKLQFSPSLSNLLRWAHETVEQRLNENLRKTLSEGLWRAPDTEALPIAIRSTNTSKCGTGLKGEFLTVVAAKQGSQAASGILVENDTPTPAIWKAKLDAEGSCSAQLPIQSLPPSDLKPLVLFDHDFRYLLVASLNAKDGPPPLTVARVIRSEDGDVRGVEQPFATVQGETATDLRQYADKMATQTLTTSPTTGGLLLHVGKQRWRVVTAGRAANLYPQPSLEELQSLNPKDKACEALHAELRRGRSDYLDPSRAPTIYADPQKPFCLLLTPLGGSDGPPSTNLQVFSQPSDGDLRGGLDTLKRASLVNIDLGTGSLAGAQWFVGKEHTPLDGWLVYSRKGIDDTAKPVYEGLPWSTAALQELGANVQKFHCNAVSIEQRTKQGCPIDNADSGAANTSTPKVPSSKKEN